MKQLFIPLNYISKLQKKKKKSDFERQVSVKSTNSCLT